MQIVLTEWRRVTGELQRRGELLEAVIKELESISYLVSHDLRDPSHHIDGYAALLRRAVEPLLSDKAARYLQRIADTARQMEQVIDDLLLFSRMGRQEMLHTTVNLVQVMRYIVANLRLGLQG